MKLTDKGILFESYRSASPNEYLSSFTDHDGATLLIDTATLVRMYCLCQFDLERRGGWESVLQRAEVVAV